MRPSLYYGFCGTDTAATVRFFKDADTLGGPCVEMLLGKGRVPLAAVAKALREIGYAGPVHCEHFGSFAGERHGEVTAAWAAGFMRALLGAPG